MGETWYLAANMQMFIVSPLLIWPLWRWRRAGIAWVLFNIVAFTCGIITIYIIWDLPATAFPTRMFVHIHLNLITGTAKKIEFLTFLNFSNDMANPHFNDDYYVQMWARFPPYLAGILLYSATCCTKQGVPKLS